MSKDQFHILGPLGKHREFKPSFLTTTVKAADFPATLNLDPPTPAAPFDPPWNQGGLGTCEIVSVASAIAYAMTAKFGAAFVPSWLFLYWCTRKLMNAWVSPPGRDLTQEDSGAAFQSVLDAANHYGFCRQDEWPYDTARYKEQPPDSAFAAASKRAGLVSYRNVAQDLNSIIDCLASGRPVLVGIAVYFNPNGVPVPPPDYQPGDFFMPPPGSTVAGGHAIMLTGWDTERRVFFQRNPWGMNAKIPFDYVTDPKMAGDLHAVTDVRAVNYSRQVTLLYEYLQNREPTSSELVSANKRLQGGDFGAFIASIDTGLSDRRLAITQLYKMLFGRFAAQSELDYWGNSGASMGQIRYSLETSAEFWNQ